jgi:hypothetical protein
VTGAGRGWLVAALGLALGGCAWPLRPERPAAGPPRSRGTRRGRHRQQAEALERDGQLGAAEEWKIASPSAPGDAGRGVLLALQARIDQAAAERLDEGRKALAQVQGGAPVLAALALDPSARPSTLQSGCARWSSSPVRADTLTTLASATTATARGAR